MNTKAVSVQSTTGESDESPFASKGAGHKGGLTFGRVLSSARSMAGKGVDEGADSVTDDAAIKDGSSGKRHLLSTDARSASRRDGVGKAGGTTLARMAKGHGFEADTDDAADEPVKDLTQAAAAATNPTKRSKEAASNAEAQPAPDQHLDALVTGPRKRLARLASVPGDDADALVFVEAKSHGKEESRGRVSNEDGKTAGDPMAVSVLHAAGLIDLRKQALHPGATGEEDASEGAIGAATGNSGEGAAANLTALQRELDRSTLQNQPNFTLPPPAPASAGGPAGLNDVASTIAPGAALVPAELGMVPEDPALNVAVLNRAAHLTIDGQDGRSLELHVRLLPEGAEIRANGELASLVQSKASDLGAALAAEGVTLNRFELGSDHRHDGQRDPHAGASDHGDSHPVTVRRTVAHTSAVETVTRPSDGRIHVKA